MGDVAVTVNFKQERIAIFIRNLAGGGAEKMMLSLANYWANEGHTIDLVLATAVGAYISDVSPQVNLIDLQCPQSKLPPALPKLVQYMKRYRPSAMLSALHYACEVAILAKYLSGVSTRIVVSERNTLSREAHTRPELSARLSPIAAQLLYPFADEIVAISNGVADDLSRTIALPRNRIRTIYNPASSKRILEMSKEKISHPWFEDSNIPVIVAVGRLAQQKDYPTLMRAVAQVNLSRPLRLVVLGKGHLKHELLNLAEKLRISDIVDFDQVHIWNTIQQTDSGWICECTVDSVTAQLKAALAAEDERTQRGLNAQLCAKEHYSWEAIAESAIALYQNFLAQ
jgi:glycosyltransferase involved in cell wall biosynthesis